MFPLKALFFDKSWTDIKETTFQLQLASISLQLLTAITLIVGLVGFLTMGTDLWDGVIVSHAVSLGRPDIYHEWFSEAGLFFTPYIYDVVYLFHNIINYETLAKVLTVVFLILSAIEVGKIASRYFEIPPQINLFTAILFYLSPAWVLYYSNIYLMHSLTLFATLICTRYLLDRKALILCLPLLLLSFQQSSNAPLSISLILLSCLYQHTQIKDRLVNAGIIIFITAGFFSLRKFFPTYGLYDTYNEIHFKNIFNVANYLRLTKYYAILYLPCLAAACLAFYYQPNKKTLYLFSTLFLGILFNGVAYIAVNKVPALSEIGLMHGESLRFTFTGTVFAALLLPALWQPLARTPRLRLLVLASILVHACAINIYAHEGKMKEVLFQRGFINELKVLAPLPHCAINIRSTGVGTLTSYEYGDVFYRAYGETNQLPLGDSKDPFFDIKELYEKLAKESYKKKYFIPMQIPNCVVDMNISTSVGKWNIRKTLAKYLSGEGDAIVNISISEMKQP